MLRIQQKIMLTLVFMILIWGCRKYGFVSPSPCQNISVVLKGIDTSSEDSTGQINRSDTDRSASTDTTVSSATLDRPDTDSNKNVSTDEEHIFLRHEGGISAVAVSPDGKYLATGSPSRSIRIWDMAGKTLLFDFTHHIEAASYSAEKAGVRSLDFSWKSNILISGGTDGFVRAFNIDKGIEIWATGSFSDDNETPKYDLDDVYAVDCSPNSDLVVAGYANGIIRMFDLNTGKRIQTGGRKQHPGWVRSVAFSPDGAQYASTSWNRVNVWDTKTGKNIKSVTLAKDFDSVSLAFSPDGKWILTGGFYESDLISIKKGETQGLFLITGALSVAFSPDSRLIAISNEEQFVIYDLSMKGKTERFKYIKPADVPSDTKIVFTPDGKAIFYCNTRLDELFYYQIDENFGWEYFEKGR